MKIVPETAMGINLDFYVFIVTSVCILLVPGGIICPLINVSAVTWFIRYIYY